MRSGRREAWGAREGSCSFGSRISTGSVKDLTGRQRAQLSCPTYKLDDISLLLNSHAHADVGCYGTVSKLCMNGGLCQDTYHAYYTDCQSYMYDRVDSQRLEDPVVCCKDGQLHNACDSDAQPHQHLTATCKCHVGVIDMLGTQHTSKFVLHVLSEVVTSKVGGLPHGSRAQAVIYNNRIDSLVLCCRILASEAQVVAHGYAATTKHEGTHRKLK